MKKKKDNVIETELAELYADDRAKGLTAYDLLYDAVETLVDTIYRHEDPNRAPIDSIEEAQEIAAEIIRTAAESAALPDGLKKFQKKGEQ
jgi:hypothetical protein